MLKVNIDAAKIAAEFKEFAYEVEQDIKKSVANLAIMTHAKVAEMASTELHSSLQKLKDNLGLEQIDDGIWVVSIDQKALWIEEGIESGHDMKEDLLKGSTKVSKSGYRYKFIPFNHGSAPSQLTPSALAIVSELRSNLRKNNIPFKKLELDGNGSPRTGKLHSLNFGGPVPGKGNTPALDGVSIYQTMTKSGNVRRDILTFRTVSDNPNQAEKWIHPGVQAKHFLDRACEWALNVFETQILPEILDKYK